MSSPSQTERLQGLQSDLQELYADAKLTDNHGQCERLAKSIAGLAKQIQAQELHEKETIPRAAAIRMAQVVGSTFAKRAKEEFGEKAIPLLTELALEIELIAEAELS